MIVFGGYNWPSGDKPLDPYSVLDLSTLVWSQVTALNPPTHRQYYPRAVYDYPCYRSHPNVVVEAMPRAEAAAREVLSLPVHPALTESDLDRIVTAMREVLHA